MEGSEFDILVAIITTNGKVHMYYSVDGHQLSNTRSHGSEPCPIAQLVSFLFTNISLKEINFF